MADEEGRLSFVAGMDDSDFVRGANNIRNEINKTANDVRKTGMTVDEFVSHMQGLVSSFDKLTQSVDRNTKAQEEVAEAGKKAAAEEKEGADKATRAIKETTKATNELGGSFDNLKSKVAGALTLASLMAFEKKVIEVRSEMESLQKSFESLAGEHVGRQLYEDIKQFATTTPMMMKDLAKGAQTLLGFNMEAEKIMPILRQIGDISMGDAQKFNSLTLAFAQMSSTGKLMGQDLQQMINAGFNPLVTISEKTGKSIGELKDEMAKGAITVEMVEDAFRTATADGGKFHNMLETQSKTMKGALSNLQGAYEDMLNEIGEKQQGVMLKGIEITQKLVQNYETVGKVLLTIIATYGTYRAAVMAATVAENLLNGTYTVKIRLLRAAAAAQKLLNKTMLANPYVLAATALAAVVSSLIAFRSRTDEASEAQKRINNTFEETQGKIAAEQKQIDSLFDKLRKAEKGTDEYKKAKDAILNQYGDYLKGLGQEIETLENVEKAYREVAKAAREAALARGREAALGEAHENYGKGYTSNLGKLQNALTSTAGKKEATEALRQIQKELRDTGTISTETEKKVRNLLRGSADYGNAEAWFTSLRKNEEELRNAIERADTLFKQESKGVTDSTTKAKSLGKAYSEAQENFEKAFNKIEDMKKSRAEYTEQQWKEAQEALKNAKKTFEELGGDPDGKQAKKNAAADSKAAKDYAAERKKLFELQQKELEEQQQRREDLEDALADLAIANERDNARRELMQLEKDHKEKLDAINKQADEWKKAAYKAAEERFNATNKQKGVTFADTDEGKAGWQAQNLTAEQKAIIQAWEDQQTAIHNRAIEERILAEEKANREAISTYIKQYGSYAEKKQDIYDAANEEICDLERQLSSATTDEAREAIEARIDMVRKGTESQIEELDQQYGKAKQFMIDLFGDASKKSIGEIDRIIKKYEALVKFMEGDGSISREKLVTDFGFDDAEIDQALDKLNKGEITVKEFTDALKNLKSDLGERSPWTKFKNNVTEALQKIKNASGDSKGSQIGAGITTLGESIQQITPELDTLAEGLGNCFNVDTSGLKDAIKTLKEMGGIVEGIGQIAKKDYVGGAISIISSLGSILSGLFDDDSNERVRKSIDHRIEVANERMSELTSALEKSYGIAAQELAERTREKARDKQVAAMEGLRHLPSLNALIQGGVIAKNINKEYNLGIEGIGDDIAHNLEKFLDGIAPEKLAEILADIKKTDDEMWARMTNIEGLGKYFEELADTWEDISESMAKEREQITGTSFENVVNEMTEALYDLADGSEDATERVADNWEKMMNRMVINNLLRNNMEKELRDWYEAWYQAFNGDKDVSEEERKELTKRYNEILNSYAGQVETMKQRGILNPLSDAADKASESFNSIRDAWVSTLTGMEGDTESLGKEIARIMFENLVQSNVFNKDFDEWLKDWMARYEDALNVAAPGEREGRLLQLEKERTEKLNELTEKTNEYANAVGYSKEANDEFNNSLDNLGDTLLNALLDADTTAEGMGKKIAQDLIREMLSEMLASEKYAGRVDEIRQMWQDILSGNDKEHTYEDVLREIAALNNDIADDDAITTLADQYKLLGENTDKAKSSFEGLRSTLKNSLTDINATTEDFRKQLEKTLVGDLIDRMVLDVPITIGEVDYKSFDEFNEKWNERYLKALAEGNEEAIALLMEELVEARNITAKAAEEYTQRLKEAQKDTTFTDMEGNFVSALMDMDGDINDFANDMKKVIVQRLVESFMVSEKIKPILDDLQETLNYALSNDDKNWTPEQRAEFIESGDANHSGINDYLKDFEGLQDVVKAIMKAIGYKAKETSEEVAGVFDNLGSSIVDSLMEAEGGVDDFMKTLTDTIVRELADSYMATEDMQKKLAEVKKGLEDAVKSGNPARIKEAQQAVRDFYADAEKGAKAYKDALVQVQQEQDTTFKDMSGDFVSALMDMGTTAEDWASQIGRTMAQRIIEQLVVTSQVQPLLDSLQQVFSKAMTAPGATWQSVMGSAEIQQQLLTIKNAFPGMQEMVKGIMEALGVSFGEVTEDAKEGFSDLRSAFIGTLTSMEGDAEAFGKSVGDTMRRQMIDKLVDKKYGQTLEQMNDAWAEALDAGDTKKMKEIIDYLEYIYGRIADDKEIKQLTEDLKKVQEQADTTFKDMNDEFVSSLMNLDATADDFGKQIGETLVRRIVEKMMVAKYLQPMLDNLQNAVDKAMNAEGATPESVLGDAGVQEMLDRIRVAYPKLEKTVSGLLEKVGIVAEDMGESVELPLENLKDTFVGFFTDLEATAEDFGKQIGETLIEEMLQEVMASKYYTGLFDEIRDHWAQALEGKGGHTIDSVTQEILDLEAAMAKDENITSLQKALKKLHEEVDDIAGDSTFKDMSDSWTQMLTNMDASAEDWGKEIGRTLVSRMVKELVVTKHLQTYLDAIQKAADDAIEKYGNSEDSMKKIVEAVTPAINDAVEATEQWKPIVDAVNEAFQNIEDTVTETPFDNIRQSFLSSLMDMKADTKDFGDDITKILTEAFINSFVLDKEFDKAVEQWKKRYSEIMGDKTLDNAGRAKQLNDLKRAISDTRASLAEEAKAIHELMGTNNVADQGAYMNTAQSFTYDQADLIGGMMTSLVMGQGEGNEVRKQILATLQAMQNVTTPKTDYGQQIFQRLGYTNDYLRDIRKTADAMLSSFTDKLNAVIERLS